MTKKKISVSIQASDTLNLESQIREYIKAGVDSIHLDIMEHKFAGNFAFGSVTYKAIREKFKDQIEIDVHFMITDPLGEIDKIIELKPEYIYIDSKSLSKKEIKDALLENKGEWYISRNGYSALCWYKSLSRPNA